MHLEGIIKIISKQKHLDVLLNTESIFRLMVKKLIKKFDPCNIFKRLYVYALFISTVHKMEDNVTKQRTSLRNVTDITV